MPQFSSVSQEETAGLGSEHGMQIPTTTTTRCKYMYCSPKVQIFIAAFVAVLSLTLIIVHVSTAGGKKGQWPPPGVSMDLYADDIYDSKKEAKFEFSFETGKKYREFTKMTTSSEYDFGKTNFVETLHMMIDSTFDVNEWTYDGRHSGYQIGVLFGQVAVETEDGNGDSTYYNSLAQNGDSDFDEVLESMVGEKIIIDVDDNYEIIDEEDNENTLEELEQEYSYGTTTGLSAVDQITQITNLVSFLPNSSRTYVPGDQWVVNYSSDVKFSGKSTFEGYVKYNGVECAVITAWAYIDEESDNILGDEEWDEEVVIENGRIEVVMFWDVPNKIPRFASLDIQMTTEYSENGDDQFADLDQESNGEGDDTVELPMTEQIELYLSPY